MSFVRFILFIILLLSTSSLCAFQIHDSEEMETYMRQIGHELLLLSGDSTSRVLPVEQDSNRYIITFESQLEILPDNLISLVEEISERFSVPGKYLIAVEDCKTKETVHSFIHDIIRPQGPPACGGRLLPKACYSIHFTFLEAEKEKSSLSLGYRFLLFSIISIIGFIFYLRPRKQIETKEENHTHEIRFGHFEFNPIQMSLSNPEESFELTHKESALLELLYSSANTVLEREYILKEVWGDEGHYVGRTLDVFISKLRKKLESDDSIKIVNIRGVGYRMIVGE